MRPAIVTYEEPLRGTLLETYLYLWSEPGNAGQRGLGGIRTDPVRIVGRTADGAWLHIFVLGQEKMPGGTPEGWIEAKYVHVLGKEADSLRAEQEEAARKAAESERQQILLRQQEKAARQAAAERRAALQRQQAEALQQQERQRLTDLREARAALQQLILWFVAMVILLACLPAYRLYAPNKLMEFGNWDRKGVFLISCGGLVVFSWGVLSGETASIQTVALAFWGGILGIPALFYLPGALLLFLQFLHYLVVPHPAEAHIDRARQSPGVALDAAQAAAEAMYDPRRDGVFEAWRANNRKRRAAAAADMLHMETAAMEALVKNQQVKARQSSPQEKKA